MRCVFSNRKSDISCLRPDRMPLGPQKGETALLLASKFNHPGVVEALLQAGAHIDVQDSEGNTPLHLAARGNYIEVMDVCHRPQPSCPAPLTDAVLGRDTTGASTESFTHRSQLQGRQDGSAHGGYLWQESSRRAAD